MKPLDNNNECGESTIDFPTIYRLARYTIRDKKFKYPTGAYFAGPYTFFKTKEEALVAIQDQKGAWVDYCFVLSEIPLGVPMRDGESFSEQIFMPEHTMERAKVCTSPTLGNPSRIL